MTASSEAVSISASTKQRIYKMQITEKLNSAQTVLPDEVIKILVESSPIFYEMVSQGYEVDYYSVKGFGGLTIVPATDRIRVKVNPLFLGHPEYLTVLIGKISDIFTTWFESPEFLNGNKLSKKFPPPERFKKFKFKIKKGSL